MHKNSSFEHRLKEFVSASDWETAFPKAMGWWNTDKDALSGPKRSYALRSPCTWNRDSIQRLTTFLADRGRDGAFVTMSLVEEFELGMDGLKWREGREIEALVTSHPLENE